MGLWELFRGADIHKGLQTCHQTPGALLLDVRTREEYQQGHIPGSKNVPLQALSGVEALTPSKDTPLFVYCRSGNRSRQAAALLRQRGYLHVHDIGGILSYSGPLDH